MIFLSGVHGVGKSYFCNLLESRVGLKTYSASSLIADRKKRGFSADKLISDIDDNQRYLLEAVEYLRSKGEEFILDGHFCLLNGAGAVTRIDLNTFLTLKPDAIVLLTERPEVIADRRKTRDNIDTPVSEIESFQNEEIAYAREVSSILKVPLRISCGSADIDNTISFIRERRT